jgi:phage shock protein C
MTTLTRSDNRMIGGVCAGIAERYGWSTTGVRVGFVLAGLLPGPMFLIYIALWIIIPARR